MRLGKHELPEPGLRRVMGDLVAHARAALVEFDPPEQGVHEVRKDMKKLRGLLRLVAPGMDPGEFSAANRAWRDIGRMLGPSREAWVRTRTAARILESLGPGPEAKGFRQTLSRFRSEHDREVEALRSGPVRSELIDQLDESGGRISRWDFAGRFVATLVAGHRTTYRRGRIAFREARRVADAEHFHEWRKHAKHLMYQTRFFRNAWPGPLEAWADELDRLTEALGDDHDCAELAALAAAQLPAKQARTMQVSLAVDRARLQRQALAIGVRLYAEKPKSFDRRMRCWIDASWG